MPRSIFISGLALFLTIAGPAAAQDKPKVSLTEALKLAKAGNLSIYKARIKQQLAEENHKEEKEKQLPDVMLHGSYARITNLTEFETGLTSKKVTPTIPEWADVTASATLPIYNGGIIRNSIKRAGQENELAILNIEKMTNDIHIEVIGAYLDIYKLMKLEELLKDNCKEEEERLKEVKALRKHGTVTNNEVLRNELLLSDTQLQLMTNKRNISIATHNLKLILQYPEEEAFEIDTLQLLNCPAVKDFQFYHNAAQQKDELRIAGTKEAMRKIEIDMAKSNYYPKIGLVASYGFNYPNYMFFPPNPTIYTLGKVGIEMTYNISGLYKNATKMHISHKKMEEEKAETSILKETISQNIFEHYTRYLEILDKIPVTEKDVAHARENYRIIRLQYMNQLALITDMVDADNALLRARYNNISAKIDAVKKYYQLQHAAGLL